MSLHLKWSYTYILPTCSKSKIHVDHIKLPPWIHKYVYSYIYVTVSYGSQTFAIYKLYLSAHLACSCTSPKILQFNFLFIPPIPFQNRSLTMKNSKPSNSNLNFIHNICKYNSKIITCKTYFLSHHKNIQMYNKNLLLIVTSHYILHMVWNYLQFEKLHKTSTKYF